MHVQKESPDGTAFVLIAYWVTVSGDPNLVRNTPPLPETRLHHRVALLGYGARAVTRPFLNNWEDFVPHVFRVCRRIMGLSTDAV